MQVLMFHSVGNESSDWYRNWLSVSLSHFDNFCEFLSKSGYHSIHIDEWYYYQDNPNEAPNKTIALTFDDGYLDNWTYVYPILEKYHLKGTIFVNPEFVEPSSGKRINLKDTNFKDTSQLKANSLGFLNWDEIIFMDQTDLIDIQSHSMSHNFYFKSDKIIDFYSGQKKYDWLSWFISPENKPFSITKHQIPIGYPVFEFGRALELKRYIPDPAFVEESIKVVSEMNIKDSEKVLVELNNRLKINPGRFETNEEQKLRYQYELIESKKILEKKLGKPKDIICWPGGGYNELSLQISKDAGYKASMISSKDPLYNNFNNKDHYKRIKRFGVGSFITVKGKRILVENKNHLIHNFKNKAGNVFYRNILRARKLFYHLKHI